MIPRGWMNLFNTGVDVKMKRKSRLVEWSRAGRQHDVVSTLIISAQSSILSLRHGGHGVKRHGPRAGRL